MIILHTDIVSEPMKPNGNPAVQRWLDQQVAETLYLGATSLSELLAGIEILPADKRREGLDAALSELLKWLFGSRIVPFEREAAIIYARLVGRARTAGQRMSVADGQIAAIATVHGFAVATRDATPFRAVGVAVVNPWEQ